MRCVWSKCFPLHWHFHCDRGKKAALRPKTDLCGQSESFSFFFNANAQATGDEHVVVKSSRTMDSHFKTVKKLFIIPSAAGKTSMQPFPVGCRSLKLY